MRPQRHDRTTRAVCRALAVEEELRPGGVGWQSGIWRGEARPNFATSLGHGQQRSTGCQHTAAIFGIWKIRSRLRFLRS